MNFIFQFLSVLNGVDLAPITYVLGLAFSVVGGITLATAGDLSFLGLIPLLIGAVILFVKIRKDLIEIRDTSKNKHS